MINQLRPAVVLTLLFTLLTGLAYPLAITGLGQGLFPAQANGSPITRDGAVVGSELIGQAFTQPQYFWPRPSATAAQPYDAAASSGSNLGPTDRRLLERVAQAVAQEGVGTLPADAVTTSASGLDPHISPDNARGQLARVAQARGRSLEEIEALLDDMTTLPALGIVGEPHVNVLALNLALDALAPMAR